MAIWSESTQVKSKSQREENKEVNERIEGSSGNSTQTNHGD